MDNKIALEIIRAGLAWANWTDEQREAFLLAAEAVKKQIPTNPIIMTHSPAFCSSCSRKLSESLGYGFYKHWENMKVCDCGQKLKWHNSQ